MPLSQPSSQNEVAFTCRGCGTEVPPWRERCNFCGTRREGRTPLRLVKLIKMLLNGAIRGAMGYGLLFGVGGILLWILTADIMSFYLVTGFGVLLGNFLGAGDVIVELVRERVESPGGRLRRVIVGAGIMFLVGIALIAIVYFIAGPPPPGGATWVDAIGLLVGCIAVGAVLGYFSVSF